MRKKLVKNIPWVISAIFWYYVEFFRPEYFIETFSLAVIAVIVTGCICESIYAKVKKIPKSILGIGLLSTIGAMGFMVEYHDANLFLAILASWFAFSIQVLILDYVKDVFSEVICGFGKWERMIVLGVTMVYLAFLLFAFIKSNAFYSVAGDLIYTADCAPLVRENAYLSLIHGENDLRQPLFAVTATPFVGAAYAIAMLFPRFRYAKAYAMGIAQMLLLLFTLCMITKMVKKEEMDKIRFFLLISLTYPAILFSIMMEQYVVVLFWTVLYIYLLVEKNRQDTYVMVGAAGSLLINAGLVVFAEKKEQFHLKEYLLRIFQIAGTGIWAVVLFCRSDVIFSFFDKVNMLKEFTGEKVLFINRLMQFTMFIRSCFVAPKAKLNWQVKQNYSWQLAPVETVSVLGIVLLALAIAGFVLNRKKLLYQISMFWVCYSFLILCVLGWGTAENGLVLYSLHFGFAYWILVYGFFDKLLENWKNRILRYVVWGCAVLALTIINSIGILELLIYARTYYPA